MSVHEEINKAIAAHAMWKQKLRVAIDTGVCESTPDKVKMDNNCAFGKWLHERIDPKVKGTAHYKEVVDLHARFHKEAGSILELALNGNTDDANKLMKIGSNFSSLSAGLTLKMKSWREHLMDSKES
ncbi:MAG: CZB domain-containing protein [Gammaproteobacteria bacterium]|nr:CZB domain-containing protein [Gammaproteobacteria bacterium]